MPSMKPPEKYEWWEWLILVLLWLTIFLLIIYNYGWKGF
jgi:uncharacterized protein YpmS